MGRLLGETKPLFRFRISSSLATRFAATPLPPAMWFAIASTPTRRFRFCAAFSDVTALDTGSAGGDLTTTGALELVREVEGAGLLVSFDSSS